MAKKKKKIVLGIETTCDETGLAIVEKEIDSRPKLINNLVYSQEEIHKKTKGVVPEVAAREQAAKIFPLLDKLNQEYNLDNIDAIAVAKGPGLVGSLLVGINLAKTLSYLTGKPLIGVNHVVAHLYGSLIETDKELEFPATGLIVSGGHTMLVRLKSHTKIELLGQSRDDAAGESFDKVAILLGLGYPGGPEIEKIAQKPPKTDKIELPRPLINDKSYDFSFSGLKTAVLDKTKEKKLSKKETSYLAYEFQEAVADVVSSKLQKAVLNNKTKTILTGGGVLANQRLREKIESKNLPNLIMPKREFSTDNGAIIATRGSYLLEENALSSWQKLEVCPNLSV